jgi:hypothetical protein
LDPSIQKGQEIPCGKLYSCVGVYLGPSPEHASTIPLVLSTTTGFVSLQCHIVSDDSFSTVHCLKISKLPIIFPALFNETATTFVDEEISKTNLYYRTWFELLSQREPTLSQPSLLPYNMAIDLCYTVPFTVLPTTIPPTHIPTVMFVEISPTLATLPPSYALSPLQREESDINTSIASNG